MKRRWASSEKVSHERTLHTRRLSPPLSFPSFFLLSSLLIREWLNHVLCQQKHTVDWGIGLWIKLEEVWGHRTQCTGSGLEPRVDNCSPHRRREGKTETGKEVNDFYLHYEMVGFPRLPNLYKSFRHIQSCCHSFSSSNTLKRTVEKGRRNTGGKGR